MPKEVKRNVKTYSEGDVYNWEKRLRDLPNEIQQKKNDNANLDLQKQTLQAQRKQLIEVDLAPIKLTIKKIKAQIDSLELPPKIKNLESELPSLKEQLTEKEEIFNKVDQEKKAIDEEVDKLAGFIEIKETEIALAEIESRIADLNNKKFLLEQEHRHYVDEILSIDKKYDKVSSQIQSLESQIRTTKSSLSSLTTRNSDYYSSQTTNDSGYSSSQTANHSGGYTSSQIITNGYTTSQYTSSEAYRNLQRQLENQQKELQNLQEHRRQLSNQRSGVYNLRDDINAQLSLVKRSLNIEVSNKGSCEQTLKKKHTDQEKLHADAKDLTTLKLKLSDAVDSQEKLNKRYKNAVSNFFSIKNKYINLKDQISNLKRSLNDAHATRGEFASNEDLNELNEQLENQRQLQSPVEQKRKEMEDQINDLSNQIRSGNKELDNLEEEFKRENENTFLKAFTETPKSLYDNLVEQITKKLNEFDRDYPINQSQESRIAIHEIRSKLSLIAILQPYQNSNYASYHAFTINEYKEKYITACGLLQKQLANLQDDKDRHLAELIEDVLHENPLEKNYALTHYLALGFPSCTPQEYEFLEKQQYQLMLSQFKNSIKKLEATIKNPKELISEAEKNLLQASNVLINKIEEHEAKPRKGETFDYKYYHNLIQVAENLAYKPNDLAIQRHFHALIQHVDNGKPSYGRQILGVGTIVLGAAVCVGSAVCGLFFLPKTWPIFAGVGAGISMIGAGIATFMSGRSHGLHQSLNAYGNAAQHSTFFQSAPSAPPVEVIQQTDQQPTFFQSASSTSPVEVPQQIAQQPESNTAKSGRIYPDINQIYVNDSFAQALGSLPPEHQRTYDALKSEIKSVDKGILENPKRFSI